MILQVLQVCSTVSGWLYVASWGISAYPQPLLNYRLQSVAGYSMDFGILNLSGYLLYSIYTVGGFIYPFMGTGEVYIVDLLFPTHLYFLWSLWLAQWWMYERGPQKTFSKYAILIALVMWVTAFIVFFIEMRAGGNIPTIINTFMVVGYLKTIVTFVKYWPQVYLNFYRKTTKGLSMTYIFCDLAGGVFSLIQQIIGKFIIPFKEII